MQHILLLTLHRSYNYEAIKADFEKRYVSFKIISVLCTELSNFLQWLYKRAKLNLLRLTQLLFCAHVVAMLSDMVSCCLMSYVGNFCMEKMILFYRLALHNDALPTAHVDKQVESAMVSARS